MTHASLSFINFSLLLVAFERLSLIADAFNIQKLVMNSHLTVSEDVMSLDSVQGLYRKVNWTAFGPFCDITHTTNQISGCIL